MFIRRTSLIVRDTFGNSVDLGRAGAYAAIPVECNAAARALQLHRIAKMSVKNARTVLQQQRVQGGFYDWVASAESRA